jgi:hypothetical protein
MDVRYRFSIPTSTQYIDYLSVYYGGDCGGSGDSDSNSGWRQGQQWQQQWMGAQTTIN